MKRRRSFPLSIATLRATCAACALLVAPLARAEQPTIYKWVDENGIAHYTTDRGRIPKEVRTRVERAPDVAAPPQQPHREDVLRDAIPAPQPKTAAPGAPAAAPKATAAPTPTAAPAPAVSAAPAPAAAPPPAPEARVEDIPAPLASDTVEDEPIDPVSAPPPAPEAPLAPQQAEELAKLDGQIASLESQIATREEKLAALISSSEEQRTTPLVDDPAFREISQKLPKLQAELQTLRERRNKIQPPATP